jgi:hypothetical protein
MSLQKTVQAIANITAHTFYVAEEDNEVRRDNSLQHEQNQVLTSWNNMGTQDDTVSKCKISKIKEQTHMKGATYIRRAYFKDVSKVPIIQVTGSRW